MSSKDAPNTARLSPADAADLADRVVEHAESWLTRDDRIAPIIVLGGPPDLEQETLRRDDEHRREQAQADLIRDGRLLAAALVAYDLDSAPLLTLLNHTKPGHCIHGAVAAEALWPQVEVALQVAAFRLRKINTDASPSTLTPENGAATAEQSGETEIKKSFAKLGDWNALTDRQRNCMRALLEFRAVDADSRQDAGDIAVKAEGRGANVNGFKEPLSDLVLRGLAESKTGRKGGYWLTRYGHELLAVGDADLATDNPSS